MMSKYSGVWHLTGLYGDSEISHNFVKHIRKSESVIQLLTARNCSLEDKQLSEEIGQASSRV